MFGVLIAAIASLAAAQTTPDANTQQQALSVVNAAISGLPACGQTCLQQIPGYSAPLNFTELQSVCNNAQADLTQFRSCLQSGCSATDLAKAMPVANEVPIGCKFIGINVQVSFPTTTTATGGATAHSSALIAGAVALAAFLF